jgi:hypothetical protein
MQDERAIFISYRRTDAGGHARNLHEYLSVRFGDDRIFFDRSSIVGAVRRAGIGTAEWWFRLC